MKQKTEQTLRQMQSEPREIKTRQAFSSLERKPLVRTRAPLQMTNNFNHQYIGLHDECEKEKSQIKQQF